MRGNKRNMLIQQWGEFMRWLIGCDVTKYRVISLRTLSQTYAAESNQDPQEDFSQINTQFTTNVLLGLSLPIEQQVKIMILMGLKIFYGRQTADISSVAAVFQADESQRIVKFESKDGQTMYERTYIDEIGGDGILITAREPGMSLELEQQDQFLAVEPMNIEPKQEIVIEEEPPYFFESEGKTVYVKAIGKVSLSAVKLPNNPGTVFSLYQGQGQENGANREGSGEQNDYVAVYTDATGKLYMTEQCGDGKMQMVDLPPSAFSAVIFIDEQYKLLCAQNGSRTSSSSSGSLIVKNEIKEEEEEEEEVAMDQQSSSETTATPVARVIRRPLSNSAQKTLNELRKQGALLKNAKLHTSFLALLAIFFYDEKTSDLHDISSKILEFIKTQGKVPRRNLNSEKIANIFSEAFSPLIDVEKAPNCWIKIESFFERMESVCIDRIGNFELRRKIREAANFIVNLKGRRRASKKLLKSCCKDLVDDLISNIEPPKQEENRSN